MDRRSFILRGSLVAGGSAFGYPMTGCGVVSTLVIPCLGPAAAPAPVAGVTYIRASEIGCALDCDLATGRNKQTGGAATDDGPRINAAMSGATADHPITLIIDGSALISGLFLPAGGYWSIAGLGCGTGFFVKKGTNNDGIHNGPANAAVPSDPGPPAPARGKNVSLSNFTLNGNGGDGSNGNSTSGKRQGITGTWYFGINLMNLDNILLEKVVVVNTPTYHIRLSNAGNVTASGCVMQSDGVSTDGLHFDGPANDIVIADCDFQTGDDSIALNCPEGYTGNISRVTVTGCTFNSWSLMRLYTTFGSNNGLTIDTVSVSKCSGTLSQGAFIIGLSNADGRGSIESLDISDCTLTAPTILGMAQNFGTISLENVTFIPSKSVCGFLETSPLYGGVTYVGLNLTFTNCVIQRNSSADVAAVILENHSMIKSLTFDGFKVQDAKSYSAVSELLHIKSGAVGQLALTALDSSNIKAPVAPGEFSSVGSVSGAGVLATGWAFPDAVMASGVPYISAGSGLPSVIVGGVIEPYPPA